MKWSEGLIHMYMRRFLRSQGWQLIAGEYPGGSDHELYPLNVVDPSLARDDSPDPRRHSLGELIPDVVALRDRELLIGEAKLSYDERDQRKLDLLLRARRDHLLDALRAFSIERQFPQLLPVESLIFRPTLVFRADASAAPPSGGFSHLRIVRADDAYFEGVLGTDT